MRQRATFSRWAVVCGGLLLAGAALAASLVIVQAQAGARGPAQAEGRQLFALVEEAERLEKEGKHLDAGRVYERAAAADRGRDPELLNKAGWNYLDAGAYPAAERVFAAPVEQLKFRLSVQPTEPR